MVKVDKFLHNFITKECLKPVDPLDEIITWKQSDVKKLMQLTYLKEVSRNQKLMKDWILVNNKKHDFNFLFSQFHKAFKSEFRKRGYNLNDAVYTEGEEKC